MLYYDAEQNPLEGELAGEIPSASPLEGASSLPPSKDGNTAGRASGVAGQVGGGPRGWKVFNCYDEY